VGRYGVDSDITRDYQVKEQGENDREKFEEKEGEKERKEDREKNGERKIDVITFHAPPPLSATCDYIPNPNPNPPSISFPPEIINMVSCPVYKRKLNIEFKKRRSIDSNSLNTNPDSNPNSPNSIPNPNSNPNFIPYRNTNILFKNETIISQSRYASPNLKPNSNSNSNPNSYPNPNLNLNSNSNPNPNPNPNPKKTKRDLIAAIIFDPQVALSLLSTKLDFIYHPEPFSGPSLEPSPPLTPNPTLYDESMRSIEYVETRIPNPSPDPSPDPSRDGKLVSLTSLATGLNNIWDNFYPDGIKMVQSERDEAEQLLNEWVDNTNPNPNPNPDQWVLQTINVESIVKINESIRQLNPNMVLSRTNIYGDFVW
jgi:hypothetical protein